MAGVTDFAFRAICTELGAALTTTEMVSAKALCYNDKKTKSLLYNLSECRPFAAQIFGHEPEVMAEAAPMAVELSGADMLDINMGCPVGKIVKSGDGSALMRDPELAGKIVEQVVKTCRERLSRTLPPAAWFSQTPRHSRCRRQSPCGT